MKLILGHSANRAANLAQIAVPLMLALALLAPGMHTQAQTSESKPSEAKTPPVEIYQTLYIANLTEQNDLNDVSTALRNMIPRAKLFSMASQHAISMHGTSDDIALAQKIVADLDRARKTYRLTFTISESEGGKRTGSERYTLIAVSGERTVLKQGSRVPIVTGSTSTDTPGTQVQYVDVGLNLEATVDGRGDGLRLRTKVEQSSLADEKSGMGGQDPLFRQTLLIGDATLLPGKPLVLGSLDVPGGTRKQEIEVVAELVP
ncbi:MAG: hypothetical protein P4L26_10275 [Terracidiphilus sp.]|nr:hypothetical protein [Terracidiphilus sp.]